MAPRDPELRRRSGGRDRSRSSGPGAFPALPMGSEVWMVPRDPELHRGTGGKERSHSSGPGEGPSLLRGWAHPFDHRKGPDLWGPWCSLVHTRKDQNTRGQQYLPQEGWTREESSRREVRGSPVQGRGTSRTVNWKFIPYSVRDHVYFRGNTCVLGAPPSCGPAPGSEVWMVPRDPELHRVTGGKERSHSSGPGEGPSLLRGDPYFFCWLVPHGVTGGWCPEILSSTKGQVGETEVAAQDVEQFQHFQEGTLLLLACPSWSNGWMVPRDPELHKGAGGRDRSCGSRRGAVPALPRGSEVWMVLRDPELHRGTGGKERSHSSGPGEGPSLLRGDPFFFFWLDHHGVRGGWCPEILSSTQGQVGGTEVPVQDVEQFQHCQVGQQYLTQEGQRRKQRPRGPLLLLLACASWSNGWMVPRDPELHRGAGGQDRSRSSRPGAAPALPSSKFLKNTLIFLHYKSHYKCTAVPGEKFKI
ncbi:uncharacterized protein LOC111752811 isoform X2 [Loxodonta africana]|uniref:uncharacterized protein LOC111752811 isoform X2 n=1 Tax=Loxodonta africana TaxID=9785 RepID=UPI0030D2DD95